MVRETQLDRKLKQAQIDQIRHDMAHKDRQYWQSKRDQDRNYRLKAVAFYWGAIGLVLTGLYQLALNADKLKALLLPETGP